MTGTGLEQFQISGIKALDALGNDKRNSEVSLETE